MNSRRHVLAVGMIVALAVSAWGEETQTNTTLRLELDLVDGSHIIGVPGIEAVPVQTSYAKMDVPLKQVLAIKVDENHETASLVLRNGDKLTGVISLKPIELATVFGTVAVGIEHVKEIGVVLSGGALPESLKKGLVLCYSFDRDENGKVTDFSGKGNHGRMINAKRTSSEQSGGAVEFDGKSAVVNAGHAASLDVTRDLTISMWVYPLKKTFGDQLQALVGKDDGDDATGRSYMVYLVGGTLYFAYGKGAGNGFHTVTAAEEIGLEKWHHVAVVHKTGVGNSLYSDGKLVARDAQGSPLPSNPNTDVILGKTQAWEPWYFYGTLDEVMLFETALSESDVKRIYGSHE